MLTSLGRREIKQLGGRCEALLTALREAVGEQGLEARSEQERTKIQQLLANAIRFVRLYKYLLYAYSGCFSMLEDIRGKMMGWMSIPKAKQFFMQDEIADNIQRSHQAIDNLLQSFQVSAC